MQFDKKANLLHTQQKDIKDSNLNVSVFSFRNSKLSEKMSSSNTNTFIKEQSKVSKLSFTEYKAKALKIHKLESLSTNTTDQYTQVAEEQKFINSYKNDLFFRKKIDMLIKEHEKKAKQVNQKQLPQSNFLGVQSKTWRTQKMAQDIRFVQLYQRYKKWISKLQEIK